MIETFMKISTRAVKLSQCHICTYDAGKTKKKKKKKESRLIPAVTFLFLELNINTTVGT
jgi:hypothetical protein